MFKPPTPPVDKNASGFVLSLIAVLLRFALNGASERLPSEVKEPLGL